MDVTIQQNKTKSILRDSIWKLTSVIMTLAAEGYWLKTTWKENKQLCEQITIVSLGNKSNGEQVLTEFLSFTFL